MVFFLNYLNGSLCQYSSNLYDPAPIISYLTEIDVLPKII